MDKWEYHTRIIYAHIDNDGAKEYIKENYPNWSKPPKFSPQTLEPDLNNMGSKGWELISLQPVRIGTNNDISFDASFQSYENSYLAVFKRRVTNTDD